jgi:hypothetical protein
LARWFSKALLALALTLCAGLPAQAAVDSATAEALMHESGLWQHLGTVKAAVRQGFLDSAASAGKAGPTAQQRATLVAIIDTAYDADRLRRAVQAVFERQLEAGHVGALQTWLKSPQGRFFTQLEERASADTGDPEAAVRKGMAAFEGATPGRQQILQQLATETQAAEAMTSMMLETTIGVQLGVLRALPGRPGPSGIELRAGAERQRAEMLKVFAPIAVALYAGSYAEASDAQLQDYLAFTGTAAGRSFTALGISAVEQAMRGAAEALGQDLVNARPGAST